LTFPESIHRTATRERQNTEAECKTSTPLAGRPWISVRLRFFFAVSILGTTAIAQAQKPSRTAEGAWTAQLNQAVALAEQGNPARALVLTNALLEQHPDFVAALKVQGMLLENAGRDGEALATYRKALNLAPKSLFTILMRDMAGEPAKR